MTHLTPFRSLLTLLVVGSVTFLITGCTPADNPNDPDPTEPDSTSHTTTGSDRVRLRPFESCDAELQYFIDNSLDLVGPYGFGGGYMYYGETRSMNGTALGGAVEESMDTAVPPLADSASVGDVTHSTTNVQEAGIDEPDTVKTNGELIVLIEEGRLSIVDVASSQEVGSLRFDGRVWGNELLLNGDQVLVFASEGSDFNVRPSDTMFPAFPVERTIIARVDISDPSSPTVTDGIRVEGHYRSARMIGDTVRLVMESSPTGLSFTVPNGNGLNAEQDATEANKRIIEESSIDDWIPHFQPLNADLTADGDVQRLVECSNVHQPGEFSGLSTLSVLTWDFSAERVSSNTATGLVASGDTVYASTNSLIVATSRWGSWRSSFNIEWERPDNFSTDLHVFDITDPATTGYTASGEVSGMLLNQFALSETNGVIRVATTSAPSWWGDGEDSQSSLVTLQADGERLVELDRIDGMGITEQIKSVRYINDSVAAIVTFRQTDPLYLIDTSDPSALELKGELKIPGFSEYLHPVGDRWLIGVGQNADEETGQTEGLQISIFDISDLNNPVQTDRIGIPNGVSLAEYDHRAFLYWPATSQVIIPTEQHERRWEADRTWYEEFYGLWAVNVDVENGTLSEAGRAAPAAETEWEHSVTRAIVINDGLWGVGYERLFHYDLSTFDYIETVRLNGRVSRDETTSDAGPIPVDDPDPTVTAPPLSEDEGTSSEDPDDDAVTIPTIPEQEEDE